MRGRREQGQATLEYAAVLALVAALLVVGGVALGAPGIANGVVRQFERALCLVGGGDCLATERRPCAVRSAATSGGATVKVAILRVGRRGVLLRSRLSDGSEELTVVDSADLGAEVGVGVDGRLEVGGVALLDAGAGVSAGALARLGRARTWHVRDRRAGDDLQHRLVERLAGDAVGALAPVTRPLQHLLGIGKGRRLPRPEAVSERVEGGAYAGGRAGADALGQRLLGGEAQAAAAGAVARRRERATGRTTYVFELSRSAGAALAGALSAGVGTAGAIAIAVTYDRRGAPLDLTVTSPGAGGPDGGPPGGGAGRTETARSLDLTRPDAAAAAGAVLAALRPDRAGDLPAAAHALTSLLASEGRIEVRRYAAAHDTWVDASAEAALVAKAGLSLSVTHDTQRLVDAWTRPAAGLWERRADCLTRRRPRPATP